MYYHEEMNNSKKQQIRNLILIVSSAVVTAFLFSALLLYKYSPTDQYNVENILISPDMVSSLKFNDKNPKTGGQSRFAFDKMEFLHNQSKSAVSIDQYTLFYQMVQSKKSVMNVSDDIRNLFNRGQVGRLKIWVKTESSASWQETEKVFQQVEFASSGGYFRIELRQSDSSQSDPYAYFYAPELYSKILSLFP